MDKVAVLIPCYNEEKTIKKVINDFQNNIPEAKIYVYDNNSTDDTVKIAKQEGAIVRSEFKQGKGNVIRRMFREIDAECYIIDDGDDTYPVESTPQMIDLIINKNYDMVVGDRLSSTYFQENKRPFHNFGNSFVRATINYIFDCNVKDIMTGFRAFSYKFVKSYPVLSTGFEIETEMTIHAVDKNMAMENLVIEYRDRPEGSQSKLNTFSDGFKVINTIIKLFKNYKPFKFFNMIAILLIIIDILVLVPNVFIPYFKSGIVEKFPTLIVGGFVLISAIISFFSGMILNTISQNEKRDFEFKLQELEHRQKILKERDIKGV